MSIIIFSCKKSSTIPPGGGGGGNTDTTATTDTATGFKDIYVAGFLDNGTKQVATYWKNGTAVTLSDKESVVLDITTEPGYVYAAGYVYQNGTTIAAYWENGTEHLLSDEFHKSSASSINVIYYIVSTSPDTIIQKAIYIGGYLADAGSSKTTQAVYWQDGQVHNFTSTQPSITLSIGVVGHSVFGCGILNGTNYSAGYAGMWGTTMSNPKLSNIDGSSADAMFFVFPDTLHVDVYACGREKNANGNTMATWWYNGDPHHFTNGDNIEYATDIKLDKNHIVYASGTGINAAGKYVAKYWKSDGTEVKLSDGNSYAWATGIAVEGDTVLVCGYEKPNPALAINIAKYWKNGVAVNLSDGIHNAVAWAIQVR